MLGSVGDRIGRRALLTLSIALMGGATLILGLLPTYAQIGVAAPLLLMLMRLIQGFSLGGEFTGSMVYTTEQSSPLMRGLVSSSTAAGTTIGFILGSGTAWLVNSWLPADQVSTLGLAHPVRRQRGVPDRRLPAAPRHQRDRAEGLKAAAIRPPLLPSLVADWLPILQTFGIVAMTNAAYYLTFTYAVERRKSLAPADGAGVPAGEHADASSWCCARSRSADGCRTRSAGGS